MLEKLQGRLALGLVVMLAVAVTPAFAGKGGNGNGGNAGGSGSGGSAAGASTFKFDQQGQQVSLGDSVTFAVVAVGLKGGEYPMVYVECRSEVDGSVTYGQLDHPDVSFVLGGGSSRWRSEGGSAACTAHLYSYGGKAPGGYDEIRELASPLTFNANG